MELLSGGSSSEELSIVGEREKACHYHSTEDDCGATIARY